MSSLQECHSCRALLTQAQISTANGACPYCGHKLSADSETDNPYAPPTFAPDDHDRFNRLSVPHNFGGKLAMAFQLLFGQLPLFTALVLTIWVPGHLLIEMIVAGNPNAADSLRMIQLNNLIEAVFGPIYVGGIITALAGRMSGERTTYVEAMRAGLHHWGRLFGARLVAGLIILLGFLALIIPGIILAIRFSLIDEVVVLEGSGVSTSRQRSTQLTSGRGSQIFLAGAAAIAMILTFAFLLGVGLEFADLSNNPLVTAACDCLIDVFAVSFVCLLFLYYWEARRQELDPRSDHVDG
jgi:hypothetical protein